MTSEEIPLEEGAGPKRDLSISCHHYGNRAVIELNGELDMYVSGHLVERLRELLPSAVSRLEIDAARVTFTDSSGLRAVLWAQTEAAAHGVEFEVIAVSPSVERVIDLAGLRETLLEHHNNSKD